MTQSGRATAAAMFLLSFSLILFELVLTRLFGVVVFASFAHLALGLALLGISAGAMAQHLRPSLVPDEGLEVRLGWLAILQGVSTLVAVVAVLYFPLVEQFEHSPLNYTERSSIPHKLLNYGWFAALLPVLTVPFAVAGLAFAGVFQRRKEQIGLMYGADLIGGAAGAVLFVPVLTFLPGPDTAFAILALTFACAAGLWMRTHRTQAAVAAVGALGLVALTGVSAAGSPLLRVQFSAGYSESDVTSVTWTPLTRLAIHESKRGHLVLLDNTSASLVVRNEAERDAMAEQINRSLVFRYVKPGSRVAILAASAGPEVAVAQKFGHTDIDAIDIARIGSLVVEKYPDAPLNPYVIGNTRQLETDGRAAILHATEPYGIIMMVHANLHSSAGQIANAWSPSLLETKEAFSTYLDKLGPDGVLSFGRGDRTGGQYVAAWTALKERGVKSPRHHIAFIKGRATMMLVKKSPWREEEAARLRALIEQYPSQELYINPNNPDRGHIRRLQANYPLLTDNRPYFDQPDDVLNAVLRTGPALMGTLEGDVDASEVIYHTLTVQAAFVALAGLGLFGIPWFRRGRDSVRGALPILLYVSCLGYGYLAVETVLIHELVLFVGHPTYALTAVILMMLLSSGLGSVYAGRLPDATLPKTLKTVLGLVLGLGVLQGWILPPFLYGLFLGHPLAVRIVLTMVLLAPLGFVMGMPFPLAMRQIRPEAASVVPWAWALNGWMSVVASLGTIFISRLFGYHQAFFIALLAYVLAFFLASRISRVAPEV